MGKTNTLITREQVLEVLAGTEEGIKDGLNIKEVQPLFETCNLKLRVRTVFYKHHLDIRSCNAKPNPSTASRMETTSTR